MKASIGQVRSLSREVWRQCSQYGAANAKHSRPHGTAHNAEVTIGVMWRVLGGKENTLPECLVEQKLRCLASSEESGTIEHRARDLPSALPHSLR